MKASAITQQGKEECEAKEFRKRHKDYTPPLCSH